MSAPSRLPDPDDVLEGLMGFIEGGIGRGGDAPPKDEPTLISMAEAIELGQRRRAAAVTSSAAAGEQAQQVTAIVTPNPAVTSSAQVGEQKLSRPPQS